jgi:hypothetical protein
MYVLKSRKPARIQEIIEKSLHLCSIIRSPANNAGSINNCQLVKSAEGLYVFISRMPARIQEVKKACKNS